MVISANHLTVLRMILVPVFILAMTYDRVDLALVAFVVAGLTDILDGFIARRFGQQTALGATLDPVADKLLLSSAFITLSFPTLSLPLPLWLTITVLSRDIFLIVGVVIVNLTLERRVFLPTLWGKATTFFQLALVAVTLVANWMGWTPPLYRELVWLTAALTIVSGLVYLARGRTILRTKD